MGPRLNVILNKINDTAALETLLCQSIPRFNATTLNFTNAYSVATSFKTDIVLTTRIVPTMANDMCDV